MPDLRDLLDLSFNTQEEEHPLAPLLPAGSPDQTLAAMAAAEEAWHAYEALPRDDSQARQTAFAAWYTAICQVAQTLGAVRWETEDPHGRLAALHHLLDSLEASRGRRNAAAHMAIQRWPQATHGQGLLVVGKVLECTEQGPPFGVRLELQVRDQQLVLPLLLASRPQDFCQPGDELIVLGRVLDPSRERIPGYSEDGRVVGVSLARRVPPAE